MFDTELLLSHTPEDAIVMMVNAENGTHFPSGTFEFGLPEVIDGRHTRIRLKARQSHHKLDEVPYDGEFDFEYYRLELGDHFQDVLAGYAPQLPISTQVVLDELKRRLKQDFFLDDIVLEEIGRTNASPYRLKAKVESLRWVGVLEIALSDTQDLTEFFDVAILSNGPTRMGALDATPQLLAPSIQTPFINGTHIRDLISQIVPGNAAEDNPRLIEVVQQAAAAPGQPLNPATTPWHESATPAAFNLHNARMWVEPYPATGVHPSNPDLNSVLEIQLDPAFTTNYKDAMLKIPYRIDDFADSQFTLPRLSRYGTKSLTDASAYAVWANNIPVGSAVLTMAGTGGSILLDGPIPYVADPVNPGPRNLYGSIVVYNGQLRPQDSQPADPTLNRVLVLNLSAMNTAYKGNFSVHYRAPIVLPAVLPDGFLNQPYSFSWAPSNGVGPYAYANFEGSFAPGHTVNVVTGQVTGSATDTGVYRVGIDVSDSRGVTVRYNYVYEIKIAELLVTGNIPDGKVGDTINFSYQVQGGKTPYLIQMVSGTYPPSLTWNAATGTFTGTLQASDIGDYSWTISVRDARGSVQILRQDTMRVEAA